MQTTNSHDHAHELLQLAHAHLNDGDINITVENGLAALAAFENLNDDETFLERCDGLSESLSLLGFAYEKLGDQEKADHYREANFYTFIGDGDGSEILALMDMARSATSNDDLAFARLCWLSAADLLSREVDEGNDEQAEFVTFCREQADHHVHEHIVGDIGDSEE